MSARLHLPVSAPAGERFRTLVTAASNVDPKVLAPGCLGLALVAPSFIWASIDRSVWPWDPAWYGQVSMELWAGLRLHPGTWPNLMTHAFGSKPPAIAWLGQFFIPLGVWLGSIPTALLLSVVLCQATTIGLLFAAGRQLSGALAGLVAALTAAAAPLTVSMSHEYFVEPLQGMAVAWLLYIMVAARHRRLSLTLAQLAGAIALGLLVKLSSPFYMTLPALATLVIAYRTRTAGPPPDRPWWRGPTVLANIALAALLSLGTYAWYSINWADARAHADTINSTLYGSSGNLEGKLSWWLPHFDQAVFLPYADWVVGFGAGIGILVALGRRRGAELVRSAAIVAPLGSVVVVLVLLALHPVNEIRYTMPLVPCVALALAAVVSLAAWQPLLASVSVALAVEFGLVTAQSFGASVALRSYPLIAAPTNATFERELQSVVRMTCTARSSDRVSVVGDDLPFLNGNTLTFLAAITFDLNQRSCYYTPLGYAQQDPNVAWQRLLAFKPPYYISLDYFDNRLKGLPAKFAAMMTPNDPFNTIDKSVFERVVHSPEFSVIPRSGRDGLIVFRSRFR